LIKPWDWPLWGCRLTQGKIERWHQILKNRILVENHLLPGDLQAQIEAFVEHYNNQRHYESLNTVTLADA
jgi:putative transposase